MTSLADELGSAFDDPLEYTRGDLGQSLATEFGLELEEGNERDRLDGISETYYSLSLSALADTYIEPIASDSERIHPDIEQHNTNSPPFIPFPTTYNRNTTPSRLRTAKSSSSSTIVPPSIYSETEDDVFIPDITSTPPLQRVGKDKASTSCISNAPESQYAGIGSFLNPKVEKDPLVSLQESILSTGGFIKQLQAIHKMDGRGDQGIIGCMERHLERINRSDKVREEQCKELSLISKDIEGLRIADLSLMSEGGLGLGVFDIDTTDREGGLGWSSQASGSHTMGIPKRLDSIHLNEMYNPLIEEQDLVDTNSNSGIPIEGEIQQRDSKTHHSTLKEELPNPPQTTQDLLQITCTLQQSLSSVLEILDQTSSLSLSTARTLKRIKTGIQTWRDKDIAAESAKRSIEIWEEARLERGLRGVWLSDALRDDVEGFRCVFEGFEKRMDALRGVTA